MRDVLRLTLCPYRGYASVCCWIKIHCSSFVSDYVPLMFNVVTLCIWTCEFHLDFLFVYFLCPVSLSAGWACCVIRAFVLSCFDSTVYSSDVLVYLLLYHCWRNCRFWRRVAGPTAKQCMWILFLLALFWSEPFGACFSWVEFTRVSVLIIRSWELFEVELRQVRSDFVSLMPIVCIPFRHCRAAD
jgi:hypothetical protein